MDSSMNDNERPQVNKQSNLVIEEEKGIIKPHIQDGSKTDLKELVLNLLTTDDENEISEYLLNRKLHSKKNGFDRFLEKNARHSASMPSNIFENADDKYKSASQKLDQSLARLQEQEVAGKLPKTSALQTQDTEKVQYSSSLSSLDRLEKSLSHEVLPIKNEPLPLLSPEGNDSRKIDRIDRIHSFSEFKRVDSAQDSLSIDLNSAKKSDVDDASDISKISSRSARSSYLRHRIVNTKKSPHRKSTRGLSSFFSKHPPDKWEKLNARHSYNANLHHSRQRQRGLDRFYQMFPRNSNKQVDRYRKYYFTLTFKDWNLEKKFIKTTMYGQHMWRLKIFLFGMIIINALFIFVDVFQVSRKDLGDWPFFTNISLRVFSILFGLVHYPFIWKWNSGVFWIEYFTAMPILVFLVCTILQSIITSNHTHNRFPIGAVLIIIALYILPRVRSILYYPISAIVIFCFVIGMFLVHSIPLITNPLPIAREIVFCLIIVIAVVISFVLNYMNEFYLRYVFILTEEVQRETDCLTEEKERSQTLLENILPTHLSEKVKINNSRFIHLYSDVSILFSDLVEFTKFSSTVSAEELISILNRQFSCFDQLCGEYRLEKIKTIGDAFFALGGSSGTGADHTADCIGLGLSMIEALNTMNHEYGWSFEIRVGVACGPGLVSVLGKEKLTFDVFGDAVRESEMMEQSSQPGRVHITETVFKKTFHYFEFEEYDPITMRNSTLKTYLVVKEKQLYIERKFKEIVIEEVPFSTKLDMNSRFSIPNFLNFSQDMLEAILPRVDEAEFAKSEGTFFEMNKPTSKGKVSKKNKNNITNSIVKKKVAVIELQNMGFNDPNVSEDKIDVPHSEKSENEVNLKLNRFLLLFDLKTTPVFLKEAYQLRKRNLKYIFFLLAFFNFALCACMVGIFFQYALSPTFISWYCLIIITSIVTFLYLIPYLSQYILIGIFVCIWFVFTNTICVFLVFLLPSRVWDQLIGIVACWALLTLNIFPNIPFIVKVFLNIPLSLATILIDIVFSIFEEKSANPFLYVTLIVQTFIQLFGSYISDLTQANVFILRKSKKREKMNIQKEQRHNTMIIHSVLPPNIMESLKSASNVQRPFASDYITNGSILFAEFYGFDRDSIIDPIIAVGILNDLFSLFDTITVENRSFKIKSIGGSYLAVSGLNSEPSHAISLANTAIAIRNASKKMLSFYKQLITVPNENELGVRVGCHVGAFSCGVVGETKYLYDTFGDSINKCARLKSASAVDKILCSKEFYEATRNNYVYYNNGEVLLKGKGLVQTYWLIRSIEDSVDMAVQTETPITTLSDCHNSHELLIENERLKKEIAVLRLIHAEQTHELSHLKNCISTYPIHNQYFSEEESLSSEWTCELVNQLLRSHPNKMATPVQIHNSPSTP